MEQWRSRSLRVSLATVSRAVEGARRRVQGRDETKHQQRQARARTVFGIDVEENHGPRVGSARRKFIGRYAQGPKARLVNYSPSLDLMLAFLWPAASTKPPWHTVFR